MDIFNFQCDHFGRTMTNIYQLGWPGMELLPCIIVDQKSREMYHKTRPLPARKAFLNTSENRYVEFARVLSLFSVGEIYPLAKLNCICLTFKRIIIMPDACSLSR